MNIPIYLNQNLKNTLQTNDIKFKDYMPAYGGESVGLDLFYTGTEKLIVLPVITYTPNMHPEAILFEENKARTKTLIPTGLHIALPKGYGAFIMERGSITKTPLKVRAGVIDPGYTGEIFVNIVNLSQEKWIVEPQSKTPFQLVVMPVETMYQILDTEADYLEATQAAKRKEGMVGSSD